VLVDLIKVILNLVDFGVVGVMDIRCRNFFNFNVALMDLFDDYFGLLDEYARLLK